MLKRVSIQNFKSLKDVTLDLQKVNLLIGPNNSGKTNFLKALEYFGKDSRPNSDEPDRDKIAYKHNTHDLISIEFKFEPENIDHSFRNYTYFVLKCQINPNISVRRYVYHEDSDGIESHSPKDKSFAYEIDHKVGSLIIYKPDPNKLDKPGPVGRGEEFVNADASNIVGFLDLMLGKYRKTVFNRIEKDINTCISEFDEIKIEDSPQVTKELKEQFPENSFRRLGLANNKQGITYWADELSEGTLYFIALLCIINQPNPPKLLLLEEPEKGIHPRRIYEVIQFIFGLVDDKDIQVIMTTHSPTVVDMFKDMPESVFIFDKDEEGATYVKNLQKDIIEPETAESEKLGFDPPQYLNGLGEAWKIGFLGGVPR